MTEVDLKTFKDIYALRMRLAEDMGVLSPVSPKPEVLEALRGLLRRARDLGEAAPDYTAYARLCNELHEQLLQLSGNLVLREITDLLYYRTGPRASGWRSCRTSTGRRRCGTWRARSRTRYGPWSSTTCRGSETCVASTSTPC